jgi:hypothetical protein
MTAAVRGADAAIEEAIRAYVQVHPGAADSAVGIQNWWLPAQLANRSLSDVQRALDALVAAGELIETQMPDNGTVYSGTHSSGKAR